MSSSYLLFCTMTFLTILDDARRRLRGGSEGTKCSRTAQYRPTRSEIRLFPHSAVSQSVSAVSQFNRGSTQFSSVHSEIAHPRVCVCVLVYVTLINLRSLAEPKQFKLSRQSSVQRSACAARALRTPWCTASAVIFATQKKIRIIQ